MALEQLAFDALKALAPCRLLSLGYPDLLLTETLDVKRAHNEQQLQTWHRFDWPIYDTQAVFAQFGIEATYLDNRNDRGVEVIGDLNNDDLHMIPGFWTWYLTGECDAYDVVLDPGTLEHCFNIGQAFRNVRNLCRPGGTIIHTNPLSMFNHGFYNISPTAYCDWYKANGDELLTTKIIAGPLDGRSVYRFKPHGRFVAPDNAMNFIVVRRGDKPTIEGWPHQWKYDPARKAAIKAAMEETDNHGT